MSSSNEVSKSNKKGKKQQMKEEDEIPELTKEETKIAKFLRLSCPNKQGNLMGMKVNFFIGNKLVDCLVESKWGPGKSQENIKADKQPFLSSRQACVHFMQRLMNKQLFYRAVKIYKDQPNETTSQKAIKDDTTSSGSTPDVRKRKDTKETPKPSNATPSTSQQNSQIKKKFKLEMHEEQKFLDSNEPFVWIYDPTSTTTYIIGLLLILGAIGICLFPLWPSQVREGVYYLSLAGASCLGAILGLAVLKYVLFGLIFVVTFGKVYFWLFPNLTEDVGFFESFVPVYKCNTNSKSDAQKIDAKDATNKESKMESSCIDSNLAEPASNLKNNKSLKGSTYEISKSTLEINSTPRDSPLLRSKTSNNEDEGFELVGDDDLVKAKDSNQ